MTKTEIEKLRRLWGPRKKYPYAFLQFPDVNEFLDAIPGLLDHVDKLIAVVQAANDLIEWEASYDLTGFEVYIDKLRDSIAALEGEK